MTTTTARATRSPAELARGVGALAITVGLLYGLPWALLQVSGSPLPHTLPPVDHVLAAVSTPDDGTLFLTALAWVGWLGWASFAVAVLTEIVAGLLHRQPPRLPALGVQQHLARRLVTAIAVLLSAPLVIAVPPAHSVAPEPRATAAAPISAGPARTPAPSAPRPAAEPTEVVVATGDTLSGLAEHHLGVADRYPEIAAASGGIVQADGRTLTDPDLIYPGWILHLPGAVTAAAPPPPAPAASEPPTLVSPTPTPTPPTATAPPPQATAAPTQSRSAASATHGDATPSRPEPSVTEATGTAGEHSETSDVTMVATVGLGALTAAGVVAALARKRARGQRHRRPGERLLPPDEANTAVERHLRAAQDPLTASDLDAALRALAVTCHRDARPLPTIRYARVLTQRIELHLDQPSPVRAPFVGTAEQDAVWVLQKDDPVNGRDDTDTDDPAPYPALVTIGRDLDGAEVLVDLEALGMLAITGGGPDPWGERRAAGAAAHGILAALAVALVTSPRAADVEVTLVGDHRDLVDALGIDTLTHTDDVDRLLVDLAAWASAVRRALLDEGLRAGSDARAAHRSPDAWSCRVLLIDADISPARTELLQAIATTEPAVPLAVVQVRPDRAAPWTLALHDTGHLATLHPLGLTVVPQSLRVEVRQLLADPVVTGVPAEVAPAPSPVHNDMDKAPVGDVHEGCEPPSPPQRADEQPAPATTTREPRDPLSDRAPAQETRSTPLIQVLGPVQVIGARGSIGDEGHRARMTEVVTFLALHPHREHHLLDDALWPGERVPDGRRNQLISRARRWLGTSEDGRAHVLPVNPDGYRLAEDVTTDWTAFTDLVGRDLRAATTDALDAALALVRGQPFAGTNPQRYAWADIDRQEMIATIVDTAHEAFRRAYRRDDATAARRAAATGLLAEPGSEALWRDALRGEWLAGDRAGLERMAERFTRLAEQLGDDLEEETEKLLAELLRPASHSSEVVGAGHGA